MSESSENKIDLLETIPQYWDAGKLPEYFKSHDETITRICKITPEQMTGIIDRFAYEDARDQREFHDKTKYLTIHFGQEGLRATPDPANPGEDRINARQVVANLGLASQYLHEGAVALAPLHTTKALSVLLKPEHMTLDWEGMTLYPALRFEIEKRALNIGETKTDDIVLNLKERKLGANAPKPDEGEEKKRILRPDGLAEIVGAIGRARTKVNSPAVAKISHIKA